MGELEEGHFEGDGHMHGADDEGAETHFTRPPLPGSESVEADLTEDQRTEIQELADEEGISFERAEALFRSGQV